jgi:hypothetical protein
VYIEQKIKAETGEIRELWVANVVLPPNTSETKLRNHVIRQLVKSNIIESIDITRVETKNVVCTIRGYNQLAIEMLIHFLKSTDRFQGSKPPVTVTFTSAEVAVLQSALVAVRECMELQPDGNYMDDGESFSFAICRSDMRALNSVVKKVFSVK